MVGLILSGYVKGNTMIGRGANSGKPCRIVNPFTAGQRLERNESLVVIHGQYGIELFKTSARKKGIGAIGPYGQYVIILGIFDRRANNGVFFFSD